MAMPMGRPQIQKILGKVRCRNVIYRKNQTSAIQTIEEENEKVEYPPIKPKFPAGEWGDMKRSLAWMWHDKGEQWKEISTIKERLDKLAVKENEYGCKLWKYHPIHKRPGTSDFQQDVTKTAVIEGAPDITQSIEIDIDNYYKDVKEIFIDKMVEEFELLSQDKLYSNFMGKSRLQKCNEKIIKSIVSELIIGLSQMHPHINNGLVDYGVDISAHWDRYGIQAIKPKPDKENKRPLSEKYFQKNAPFQSDSHIACQLRTRKPLPEFLPRDHSFCTSAAYPECRIWPGVLGLSFDWAKPKCDPGFRPNNTYQFVNLSFIPWNKEESLYVLDKFGEETYKESQKYFGMNTGFISTVAQAYYQGFSTYVDLTYPLTTQTVMTDGRLFSIYSYQLNTLHLWKDDSAHLLRNICYIQDSLPMYDIIENGQMKGFNDDTFKALMRCFALVPCDRGYDMRPTLPIDSPDRFEKEEYIPPPVKEIIVEEKIVYDHT